MEQKVNPDAVDLAMQGWALLRGQRTRETVEAATALFERALKVDPNYTAALVGFGRSTVAAVLLQAITTGKDEALKRAEDALNRALAIAPNDATAHWGKGEYFRMMYNAEAASAELEIALTLNPNLAEAYSYLAITRSLSGHARKGLPLIDKAIELSPRDRQLHTFYHNKCHVYAHLADDKAVIEWCTKSLAMSPYLFSYEDLIATYGWKNRQDEARKLIPELYKLMPNYTIKRRVERLTPWVNPVVKAELARITEGLRKAGVREE